MKSLTCFYVLLTLQIAFARECKQLVSEEVSGPHNSITDHEICRKFASTLVRKTCSGDSGIKTNFVTEIRSDNCKLGNRVTVEVCSGDCGNTTRTVTATLSCRRAESTKCSFEYQVYNCDITVAECHLGGQCKDCKGKQVDHKFCPLKEVQKKCVDKSKNAVTNKPAESSGE